MVWQRSKKPSTHHTNVLNVSVQMTDKSLFFLFLVFSFNGIYKSEIRSPCEELSGPVCWFPPDHSVMGLITKTSILVGFRSHSVSTLMGNMWRGQTHSHGETQYHRSSIFPFFSCFIQPSFAVLFFFLSVSLTLARSLAILILFFFGQQHLVYV